MFRKLLFLIIIAFSTSTINGQAKRLISDFKANALGEFELLLVHVKEGKNQTKGNPELFFEYNNQKEKEVDLIKTTPPNLNNFYKKKVTQYFQNINE